MCSAHTQGAQSPVLRCKRKLQVLVPEGRNRTLIAAYPGRNRQTWPVCYSFSSLPISWRGYAGHVTSTARQSGPVRLLLLSFSSQVSFVSRSQGSSAKCERVNRVSVPVPTRCVLTVARVWGARRTNEQHSRKQHSTIKKLNC